ncbi:MAG: hypothetical protein B7Y12_05210 [Rhizobiales bacterium 24-66-13]|nr:MAG: hypothetical protein B7Y61_03445 [Rhizobiales bacterium 35-66-30]OYZ82032.1 MAG: hypothetical protein B7Y12_05210 [Rhizobiales bacterium 24-66-13]OZB11011.1 MAG: hypothetical protein B7X67_05705 [Rhizobiales bacterium 39-66-18]HQS47103.1 NAD(P)-dependent oxidoreductase [Xanthobacteraceae bacterium]
MFTVRHGFSLFEADLSHIDQQLAALWGDLHGARLLLTGGTGFFGIWMVEALLYAREARSLDMEIHVLTRDPDGFLARRAPHLAGRQGLVLVPGTVTDFEPNPAPYTHILHMASETNVEGTRDWAARHLATAIIGTQRLIDIAAAHGTQSLLITTSGAVYGQSSDRAVNRRWQEGPGCVADLTGEKYVYGEAKRMMEIMVAVGADQHGYRALTARCFAFVGPYLSLDSNYAIGNFIRDAMHDADVIVGGDGTPLRSYLYAADLVAWLLTILLRGQSGRPYNVGGSEAISIAELARRVNIAIGGKGNVIVKQTPVPGAEPHSYLPDLTRTRTELGLDVTIGLEEAVRRTAAWYRMRASA